MTTDKSIEKAVDVLRRAEAILITTGAGMGVDSGLPDFRGKEGFWKAYPPLARLGKSFVEMANPEWFDRDPKLAWAFYGHRLHLYRKTRPHAGFAQLLAIADRKPGGCFVFTSNVDGHFQAAGFGEDRIEECHGSIHFLQCIRPCCEDIWPMGNTAIAIDEESFRALDPLPRCRFCGGIARPNILMFGDWAWNSRRTDEQGLRLQRWLRRIASGGLRLAIVEIGAGKAVATVRCQSERLAGVMGATLIRINPRDFDVPNERHVSLPMGGAEAINAIFKRMPAGQEQRREG